MLASTLWKHRVATGENEGWSFLGEIFNPVRKRVIIEKDGHLENLSLRGPLDIHQRAIIEKDGHFKNSSLPQTLDIPQLRSARIDLFLKHSHQEYVVKVLSQDTIIPEIVPWMRDNYRIVCIERRNVLSAFVSALIAHRYQIWSIPPGDKRPEYEPFVVEQRLLNIFGTHFVRYYRYRDELNPTHILYYEDIANASQQEIIEMVDMVPIPDWEYTPPSTIKLHSFQEKLDLIQNLDEVTEHFVNLITPYGVVMEHNNL